VLKSRKLYYKIFIAGYPTQHVGPFYGAPGLRQFLYDNGLSSRFRSRRYKRILKKELDTIDGVIVDPHAWVHPAKALTAKRKEVFA